MALLPDLPALVAALLRVLPLAHSGAQASHAFSALLTPALLARVRAASTLLHPLALTAALAPPTAHDAAALLVARALHAAAASRPPTRGSAVGFKRLDHASLVGCATLPLPGARSDAEDEDLVELIFLYTDVPGCRGWKLHEVRLSSMDEPCYWRRWCVSVEEAEAQWAHELVQRAETARIRALLIQSRCWGVEQQKHATAATAQRHCVRDPLAFMVPQMQKLTCEGTETDTRTHGDVYEDEDERDYWSRYDDGPDEDYVLPSPELARALRKLERFRDEQENDDYYHYTGAADDISSSSSSSSVSSATSSAAWCPYGRPVVA
ncbi:uncharacterized protein V1518DRAFT_418866 [Limtongia smithiae]|uniref:uncharacterized protein n=1 Tax=Limtongia smithiae TaxID=1125753 RepID=UPI0034CF51CD